MSKPSAVLKNDQWFKFYYLRILVSCKGWKDDEFGAYVKLLIHQFDKGFIPDSERELKKIITTHKKNWQLLKSKFPEVSPGVLMNDVMKIVRDEYDAKKKKNTEIGKTGGRPKKTERLSNGFEKETHIYSSSLSNSDSKDRVIGEEKKVLLLPAMLETWKATNPNGFIQFENDMAELMEIAKKLKEWMSLKGDVVFEENSEKIKRRWEELCLFVSTNSFLKNYSLSQINTHIASVIQSFNNRNNGSETNIRNPKAKPNKSTGAVGIYNDLKNDLAGSG